MSIRQTEIANKRVGFLFKTLMNGGALLSASELVKMASEAHPDHTKVAPHVVRGVQKAVALGVEEPMGLSELRRFLKQKRRRMTDSALEAALRHQAEKRNQLPKDEGTNLSAVVKVINHPKTKSPKMFKGLLKEMAVAMKSQKWGKLELTIKEDGNIEAQPTPAMPEPLPSFVIEL